MTEIPKDVLDSLVQAVDEAYNHPGRLFYARLVGYWTPPFFLLSTAITLLLYAFLVKIIFTDLLALLAVALALASIVLQYRQDYDKEARKIRESTMSRRLTSQKRDRPLVVIALIRLRIFSDPCTLYELYQNDPAMFSPSALSNSIGLGRSSPA